MLLSQNFLGAAGVGGPPAPPDVPLEYVDKVQVTTNNQTSYNFVGVPCGATGPNRTMLFTIWLENTDSATFTTPTVTVNGDIVAPDVTVNVGTGGRYMGIYRARPSGGSCNIDITDFGVNADNAVIFIHRADALIELYDWTRYSFQNSSTSSNATRRTIGVPADGFVIGAIAVDAASGTLTLTYDGSGDITAADDAATDGSNIRGEVCSYDNDGNDDATLFFGATPSSAARRAILAASYAYRSSPAKQKVKLLTALGNYSPGSNRTIKVRIPATWLLENIPSDANRWIFRFTSAQTSISTALNIDSCYIGHAAASGDAYDAASLTQLMFGGGASIVVSNTTAARLENDVATFAWDGVSDLILSAYVATSSMVISSGSLTGARSFRRSGDFASTADAASFVEQSSNIYSLIECIRAWKE